MTKRRAALAALLLTGTLAGCGVTSTDVIEVGQPASGAKRPGTTQEKGARIYLMSPTGVKSVPRDAKTKLGAEDAVALLLNGPEPDERVRGLYSDLPRMRADQVHVTTGTLRVSVQMPFNVLRLSPVARSQFVCTAADNETPPRRQIHDVKVELSGGGYTISDLVCDSNNAFPAAKLPSPQAGSGGGGR
ncbi:GerMN domain-containing protein [Streptomyces albireticuli]|uniref:Lipoprotein n=1 Tax=Streptomyces albireticuli TaxID=1940 RepID=A0A2A2CY64_9ACTN|nr:GerMN domain-containing protein [Streptomyces albireticuli]MCD9141179.1 GerMN domain-containing protein [Streptomyces albireticuli]MCD9160860.1 GerMN domain-containing protein [Streptomyces albireticuli]MCD9191083.1 GerMN domain-containing protein [Streptomyces albireticuli]PAU44099.1 hypothetical protein CK936_36635 [Streptomyces albireticuli]